MRSVISTIAAVAALSIIVPVAVSAQGLTILNYQFISEQRSTRSEWFVTYRADVINTGLPRTGLTATVSSLAPTTVKVVTGQNTLHFGNVPTGTPVASLDTFTILVDRSVPFDFANLQWVFLSPSANPGPNQTVAVASTVNLDGSGSTNSSGIGGLTYSWVFNSKPSSSNAVLANANTVSPSFKVDAPGSFVITLTVSNGIASDSASVRISTKNSPPVANAGPNQSGSPGSTILLDGSGSSDVDGDSLTYFWTMISKPAGSNAFVTNFRSVTSGFVMDTLGVYIVKLVVNDGKADSEPSTVTISSGNTRPVAKAESNPATVNVGALVQLSGAKSTDVDGDALTYKWSLTSVPVGSTVILSGASIVNPTFTPDKAGAYVAQLIVNDGKMDSEPSTVTISANSTVQAPSANAGANQSVVAHGTTVTLNGSGTDPQNLPLAYSWSLVTKPVGSTATLSSTTAQKPTFVADLLGDYVAQLIVSNGSLNSAPATVTITNKNTRPVANAGVNQNVLTGATISLDGIGSTDADGDPLTYSWTLTTKPQGSTSSLSAALSRTPTFFADVAGTYVVQLIVNDGFANSDPATVTITAAPKLINLTPGTLTLLSIPGVTGTLNLSLSSPAPAGGLTVDLTGFDTSVISLSKTQVTFTEGSSSATIAVTPLSAGATTILASGGTYQPGTATVTVTTPAITVSLNAPGVKTTYSINGTITLSAPAPAGGINVALSVSPGGLVSFNPPTVNIAAGSTSGSFSVTGVNEGSGTITGASGGFAGGTAGIEVTSPGSIALASGVAVGPGQSASIPVTLSSAAPVGGVTLTLTSSDPTKATVTASVTIAAGQTTPAAQPQVMGVAFGSVTILASGGGYKSDSQTVMVGGASLGFGPTGGLTLIGATAQNLGLTLSAPAPAGGLVVNLSAAPVGVVNLPATVAFIAGATSANISITGISAGTTTITASSPIPGITGASTAVSVQNIGAITLTGANVALGQSVPFQVTLSAPAPAGGTTITLSSSSNKIGISPATVTIAAGATTPAVAPQLTGSSPGSASIIASAPFYTQGTAAVSVTATISLTPATLTINGSETKNLTLTLSGPAPTGGLTVTLSSSSIAAATVPATVAIAANATTVAVPVTGVAAGSTTIRAAFAGLTDATAVITVVPGIDILIPATISANPGDSVPYTVKLANPAPQNGVVVNLVSSDPAKATLTLTSISFNAGQTTPTRQPSLNATAAGSLTVTASATGMASAVTQVTVGTVMTLTPSPLQITGAEGTMTLTLSSPAASNISVALSSSNAAVAIVPASLPIAAGATSVSFKVTAVGTGATTITATAPGYPAATASAVVSNFLSITNSSLPNGTMNAAYSATMSATGGTTPFSWSATGLPAGLSITSAGVISGTPSEFGAFSVLVKVTDSGTPPVLVSKPLNLTIAPAELKIVTTSLVGGVQGIAYSATVAGSGGVGAYKWSATGLPAGLSIASTSGMISGTTSAVATTYSAVITLTDSATPPVTTSKTLPLVLNTPSLAINTTSLAGGTQGVPYSATVAPTGGTGPYNWTATGLPAGLSIAAASGLISGTPTANGLFSVAITATDSATPIATATKTISLTIAPPLVIGTSALANGTQGLAYTATVAATGGTGAYSWSATGLPAGLSITPATGVISGTPTANGSFSVVVTVADSSTPAVTTSKTLSLTIVQPLGISTATLANGTVAVAYSATVTAAGGTGAYTWSATGLPAGLSIAAATGVISGTPTVNGVFSAVIAINDSATPPVSVTKTLPLTIVTGVAITTSTLPNGTQGVAYSATVAATGGTGAYNWSATGLPAGLTIAAGTGLISGAPTASGAFSIVVTLTDSATPPASLTKTLPLTIVQPLAISTATLANGMQSVAYTATIAATGGTGVYSWSATGLPAGLTIASGTGVISGTPTASGTSSVVVTVTDSASPAVSVSKTLSLVIAPPLPAISTGTLPAGVQSVAYTATVTGTGGTGAYSWSATGLPANLTINASTGVISGTPAVVTGAATYTVVITLADSATPPVSVTRQLSLLINTPDLTLTTTTLVNGAQGIAYSAAATATGGTAPYIWSATGLPAGLSIATGTGVISGTPTVNGPFQVVLTVRDSATPPATKSSATAIALTIAPPLVISTGSLASGAQGTAYTATVAATGGTGAYSWSATGLPAGLSIAAATGVISGTSTANGSFQVVVTVGDASTPPVTATKTISLTIAPPLVISTSSLANGTQGVAYSATVAATGGTGAYNWSATGLPTGLTIAAGTGVISGTPSANGAFPVILTVADSATPPVTVTKTISLTIATPLVITTSTLANGAQGTSYSATVASTGGSGSYNWSATGLPTGLSIAAGTGVISGTPTANGAFAVVVKVNDASTPPVSVTKTLSLTIVPPLAVSTSSLANGTLNAAYSATVAATGGTGAYIWSATGLPAGLSMAAATGVISGTPTANGTFSVVITVTDSATPPATVSKTISLVVGTAPPASITVSSGNNQSTKVNTAFAAPVAAIVKDANGLAVPGVTVTFTTPVSGASGNFTVNTAITDINGIAGSATLTANTTTGSYNVTATAGALTVTFAMTNKAGNPAAIAVSAGSGQSTLAGSTYALPLKAVVTDSFNNLVSGVTVTFTAPGQSLPSVVFAGGNTSVTDASGVATSGVMTANTKANGNPFTVTATVAGVATPSSFLLNNLTGPVAAITAISGANQQVEASKAFTNPLQVLVTDAFGNPLRGYTVTFAGPVSGASATVSPNTAVTDNGGVAASGTVTANGAVGSYNVTASISGAAATGPFALTNTPCLTNCPGVITAPGATIGKDLQAPILIIFNPPVPLGSGGVPLTITSTDPSKALVGGGTAAGKTTITATMAEGSTTVSTFVQALVGTGTADITLSAPGYLTTTVTINFANSGFVVTGPNGVGQAMTVFKGSTTTLAVNSVSLTAAGTMSAIQQVRGGLTVQVPVSSSVTAVGSISSSNLVFSGGSDTGLTPIVIIGGNTTGGLPASFVAVNTGSSSITVPTPSGFSSPTSGGSLAATVTSPVITGFAATLGQGLEKAVSISISAPASTTGDTLVTITSNDPSKMLFSTLANTAGSASITLAIPKNQTRTSDFYVQATAASGTTGTASYNVSIPNFATLNSSPVTLAPTGLRITSPGGVGATSFSSSAGGPLANILVETGRIAGGVFAEAQSVSGGNSVTVTMTSSNTAVGSFPAPGTLTVANGNSSATALFSSNTNGPTTITASAANYTSAAVTANVTGPKIILSGGLTIGKFLQDSQTVILNPAPPVATQVTITSSDASMLKLSTTANGAGAASITLDFAAGQSGASIYVQALSDNGSASYTASASGYPTTPAQFSSVFQPSGIVIQTSSQGTAITGAVGTTINAASNPNVIVYTAILTVEGTPSDVQPLAGGSALQVAIQNNHPEKAAIPCPTTGAGAILACKPGNAGYIAGQGFISIAAGTNNTILPITLLAPTDAFTPAVLSITAPGGYTDPTILTTMRVTVQ